MRGMDGGILLSRCLFFQFGDSLFFGMFPSIVILGQFSRLLFYLRGSSMVVEKKSEVDAD